MIIRHVILSYYIYYYHSEFDYHHHWIKNEFFIEHLSDILIVDCDAFIYDELPKIVKSEP